jgi:hypothetical protein
MTAFGATRYIPLLSTVIESGGTLCGAVAVLDKYAKLCMSFKDGDRNTPPDAAIIRVRHVPAEFLQLTLQQQLIFSKS